MTTTATIDAALVAAGIGLPLIWRARGVLGIKTWTVTTTEGTWMSRTIVDLSDDQTRSGLLQRLAVWAGDSGQAQAYYLVEHCGGGWLLCSESGDSIGFASPTSGSNTNLSWAPPSGLAPIEALACIVERIGRDHRIRRALGWDVEPGTLASLKRNGAGTWFFGDPDPEGMPAWSFVPRGLKEFHPGVTHVPALAGNIDPRKVLAAIDEVLEKR
jgi:hypothetical protein